MAVSTFLVGFLLLLLTILSCERDQVGMKSSRMVEEIMYRKKGKPCSHAVDSEETDYIYEYEINAMYEYECTKIIVIIAMVGCRAGECGAVPCRIFDFMAYKNYTNCLVSFVSLLIIVDL